MNNDTSHFLTIGELQQLALAIAPRIPKNTPIKIIVQDRHITIKNVADDTLITRIDRPVPYSDFWYHGKGPPYLW